MEKILHSSLGLALLIIIACFMLAFIVYLAWPKRKLCQVCKKTQTNHKNDDGLFICEDCEHKQLLQKAEREVPPLFCPMHGDTRMDIRILPDFKGFIVYECPHPECNIMVIDKNRIKEIIFWELDFYPSKPDFSSVQKEKK